MMIGEAEAGVLHIARTGDPRSQGCGRSQKGLSATDIRRRMAQLEPWEGLVPHAVAKLMKKWDIPGRLRTSCSHK